MRCYLFTRITCVLAITCILGVAQEVDTGGEPVMEPSQGGHHDIRDSYTIILKNGESFTAVCPWTYGEFLAVDLGLYKNEIETACLDKNFSKIEDCDTCLSEYLYYFEEVENSSRNSSSREAARGAVLSWMPDFRIIPLIDFTQGCPWETACKREMHMNVQASLGNELADTIYQMLSECQGVEHPGPDYNKSWLVVQNEFRRSGINLG